jgi:hypothetical protein
MSTRWAPSGRRRLKYFAVHTYPPIVGQGALCRFLFSAEGAGFNPSLGQRPRTGESLNASAEGAIQPRPGAQPYESRFQRSCMAGQSIPGALPQAKRETAPLALKHRPAPSGCPGGRPL